MGQFMPPRHIAEAEEARIAVHCDRPVDLVHLARHTLGDPQLEREVLQLFVVQSRIYLRRLKEAMDERTWREAAHTIKGSARGIGAWGVAKQAETTERLTFDPDADRCRMAVVALENHIDSANTYIRSLFTEH